MVSYIFGFMGKSTFQLDIICFKLQIALGAFLRAHARAPTVVEMLLAFEFFKFNLHFNLVTKIIIFFPPNVVITFDLTSKLFERKTLVKMFQYAESHCNVLFHQQHCRFEQ